MIQIAAESQSVPELVNRLLTNKLSRPLATANHSEVNSAVAFIGYSSWRREENGDANLSDEQVFVVRDGQVRFLDPRYDIARFSPDGLSWGYPGSGSGQLAIAMLTEVLNDPDRVRQIWARFHDHFIVRIPRHANWTADGSDILAMALAIERHQELDFLIS